MLLIFELNDFDSLSTNSGQYLFWTPSYFIAVLLFYYKWYWQSFR